MFQKLKNKLQNFSVKKLSKKKLLLVALLMFLIISGVGAFFVSGLLNREVDSDEETLVESELYWNVDRESFVPKLGGVTTRKPEKDGLYTVRFLVKGELVEYRVKDKKLMIEIDNESAMGLIIGEDDIITEAVSLDRMGVREVAKRCYVQDVSENSVTVNTSAIGDGTNIDLKLKEGIGIWNVTGTEPVGEKTVLQTLDCVRAFNSPEGGITDVFVVDREEELTGVPIEKYCEHCKQVVKWRMWIAENSLPTSEGHWRLIRDVDMAKQHSIGQDVKQIFDLNGKTVTAAHKGRLISLHKEGAALAIMDLSEEQTGTLKGLGDGGYGSVIWVRYGVLDLYSGTVDATEVVSSGSGAAVRLHNKDTVFNMYGGTIIGGTSQAVVVKDEETGKESLKEGVGGALAVKGTVNMYGGVIRDGKAVSCKDSKGNQASVSGGNIFLYGGATFNMYDGVISGGKLVDEGNHGANIRIAKNAVFNMEGGVIENGVCLGQGANIGLYGTLNMSGGTIRGGKVMSGETLAKATYKEDSLSHNIFCVNGTLNMTGGLIEGYVRILDNGKKADGTPNECTVKISGTAKIKGGKTNLSLNTGDTVDFGTLKKGAAIYIDGAGYVSTETVASNRQYVHSDYGVEVLYENKKLLIGKMSCVCGQNHVDSNGKVVKEHFGACNGTSEMWMPWTSATSLPTTEGNWYLISDVKPTRQFTVEKDTTMKLDLNGYRVYGLEGTRVYSLRNDNVRMTLTDLSSELDGKIVARESGEKTGYGNCIWVSGKSSLIMYGGHLDASGVECPVDGVAVNVSKNCEFTMYGGSIKGGTSATNGGTVSVNGKFNMYGGTISDGIAKADGGNIFVASGGEFNLYGGEVREGVAGESGGNIGGTNINIFGGTICYGKALSGGNVSSKRAIAMSGGLLKHGVANVGGNVFLTMNASFNMSGGTLSQGVAQTGTGGNLRTLPNCKVEITGGVIENGIAETDGGNIWMNGGSLKMTGGAISGGRALEGNGGNICTVKIKQGGVTQDTALNLRGGSIVSGRAAVKGANVYVKNGDVTLAGNIAIKDGTVGSAKEVSNLYLEKGITAKLDGLTGAEASIGVTCEDSIFATNANVDQTDVARFTMDDGYPIAQSQAKELFVGTVGCMCGGHRDDQTTANDGHEDWCTADLRSVEWHAWRNGVALPGTSELGNYYYLTEDVNIKGQMELAKEGNYGIDLNGYKITQNSNTARIYAIWNTAEDITFNITDTSAERKGCIGFKEGMNSDYPGALLWMRSYTSDVDHTVNVYAGTLDAGNLTGKEAPIYVQSGNFNVYGGTVLPKNQTVKDEVTNGIRVTKGTLAVNGGTIEGEILLSGGVEFNLGGAPKVAVKVTDNADGAYGIRWTGNITLTGDNVASTAEIILADVLNVTVQGTGDERGFTVLQPRNKIADDSNGDGSGNLKAAAAMCVCGETDGHFNHTATCKQPASAWQPWNASASIKLDSKWKRVGLPWVAGSYYLTENLTGSTQLKYRSDIGADVVVNLDLAGHVAEGPGKDGNIYRMNGGELNIADSSVEKTGAIRCTGAYDDAWGRVVYIWGNTSNKSCVNLYGGTLAAAEEATGADGVVVNIYNGTFNMYGGEILPGTCVDSEKYPNGANSVRVGSNKTTILNVMGGTIKGEVHLATATAKLNISGSAKVGVSDGTDKPYGIYAPSTLATAPSVVCTNVAAVDGGKNIVLKDERFVALSGTGEGSAFEISENLHNKVKDVDGTLELAARMCNCGALEDDVNAAHKYNGETRACAVPTTAWQPWNAAISAANDSQGRVRAPWGSGSYYLTGDINHNGSVTSEVTASASLDLDLAGHQLSMEATGTRVYSLLSSATLNITDSGTEGRFQFPANSSVDGAHLIWMRLSGCKLNLFGGSLTAEGGSTTADSAYLIKRAYGQVYWYGGNVIQTNSIQAYSHTKYFNIIGEGLAIQTVE